MLTKNDVRDIRRRAAIEGRPVADVFEDWLADNRTTNPSPMDMRPDVKARYLESVARYEALYGLLSKI